jgi:hypothetical protein
MGRARFRNEEDHTLSISSYVCIVSPSLLESSKLISLLCLQLELTER